MVHKEKSLVDPGRRARGRPRAYDAEQALAQATLAFWQLGYSATSLDQLSDATDMNRPSLYAAFGDKHGLYLRTLDRYTEQAKVSIAASLDPDLPLADGLRRFYESALASYLPPGDPARGCYLIGTAVTEALSDESVRSKLAGALREFERLLEARLQKAHAEGELNAAADPTALTTIAAAILYTLAIRSRAGESKAVLRAVVDTAIGLICGTSSSKQRAKSTTRAPARRRAPAR
jgi:TetR/AcrR family transcriptional regulator, copper-responsive repressor